MIRQEPLFVILVKLVDQFPEPALPAKRRRGRPDCYSDRLIVKALIIMIIRRLYSAYSLLAFLDQPTELTRRLRAELTRPTGRFPSWRTWERWLKRLPDWLPGLIGALGRHLVVLFQPWYQCSRTAAVDSTAL